MSFELPKLLFANDSLKPYISEETLEYHYSKHHQAYINKLNQLIENTEFANKTLEEIIKKSSGSIFNNAAQAWNHNFYWQCLGPNSPKEPKNKLIETISRNFGSFAEFKNKFKEMAILNFGSGWTWLVKKSDGTLDIVNTSNAANPLTTKDIPLLTCDVWEHAYYIDYRNDRGKYVDNFWNIIDWNFVIKNF